MDNLSKSKHSFDIVIVGGGPVGLLLFRLFQDLPYEVGLIEKQPELIGNDLRSYILNRKLIDQLIESKILNQLDEQLFQLRSLIVSTQGSPVKFRLRAGVEEKCLKYVIGATHLRQDLATGVLENPGLFTGAQIQSLAMDEDGVNLQVRCQSGDIQMHTRVLIATDGANSPTAKMMGIEAIMASHSHHAMVLSLRTNRAVAQQAEQCLTGIGPISVVPRIDRSLGGVVVSNDAAQLAAVNSPSAINALLEKTYHGRYGRLELVGKAAIFPIQPQRRAVVHKRGLVMGDAACTLSPVAAQGLSLGMDSAVVLHQHLLQQQPDLSDAGAWSAFASNWQDQYTRLYKRKQDLNQLYARSILNLSPFRWAVAPTLAALGLSPQLRRALSTMLSG